MPHVVGSVLSGICLLLWLCPLVRRALASPLAVAARAAALGSGVGAVRAVLVPPFGGVCFSWLCCGSWRAGELDSRYASRGGRSAPLAPGLVSALSCVAPCRSICRVGWALMSLWASAGLLALLVCWSAGLMV